MFVKLAMLVLVSSVAPAGYHLQDSKKAATRKKASTRKIYQPGPKTVAWSLSKMDNWVRKVKIQTMESAPPKFAVVLSLWMPSPGYKLTLDSVDRQADGRVLVKITGQRPKGMAPMVMTETDLTVTFNYLKKGEYLLDVWGRLDKTEKHRRRGMALLQAKGL